MKNRKGISAVVATVLIILITVAAVTIIWAAIIPMIKNQISGGTTCLDAVSQVSLVTDAGYTCKNLTQASTNFTAVNLQVKHGPKDFTLAGIQVLVTSGGNTYAYDYEGAMPGANEEKVINVTQALLGITNASMVAAEKVEIAPIVAVGNTQEKCDVSASATLQTC
jgi:flagellin-like protein